MNEIIESGRCKCVYEPRGDYALEGYQLNDFYDYELKIGDKGRYFKVYPGSISRSRIYGECCSVRTFRKCFEISGQC